MKLIKGLLIFLIICSFIVYGQTPAPEDIATLNKIAQEHQNTRKFMSDELSRQRNEFFKEVDDRANYYEKTVESILTTTVFKLALLWGGIMFFFVSFNNFIRNRLEKKRYKRLKENIIEEINRDPAYNPYPVAQQNPIIQSQKGYGVVADTYTTPSHNALQQPQPSPPQPHISQMSKRKQKRLIKELRKLNKNYEFYALEKAKVETRLGIYEKPQQQQQGRGIPMPPAPAVEIPPPPQPQQQQPQQPQAEPEPDPAEYKYDFEVNY